MMHVIVLKDGSEWATRQVGDQHGPPRGRDVFYRKKSTDKWELQEHRAFSDQPDFASPGQFSRYVHKRFFLSEDGQIICPGWHEEMEILYDDTTPTRKLARTVRSYTIVDVDAKVVQP